MALLQASLANLGMISVDEFLNGEGPPVHVNESCPKGVYGWLVPVECQNKPGVGSTTLIKIGESPTKARQKGDIQSGVRGSQLLPYLRIPTLPNVFWLPIFPEWYPFHETLNLLSIRPNLIAEESSVR
jgi:hypothetical protein